MQTTKSAPSKREAFVAELRAALEFFESHPEVEINDAYFFCHKGTKDGAYAFARARGEIEKSTAYEGREFEEFRLDWHSPSRAVHMSYGVKKRDCCEKRVVTKEVVEYVCDPILSLGGAA